MRKPAGTRDGREKCENQDQQDKLENTHEGLNKGAGRNLYRCFDNSIHNP
jgi:hypothetical protein